MSHQTEDQTTLADNCNSSTAHCLPSRFPLLNDGIDRPRQLGVIPLSGCMRRRLSSHCDNSDSTMESLLVAAWGLVLRMYADLDDVLFGLIPSMDDFPKHASNGVLPVGTEMLSCHFRLEDTTPLQKILETLQNALSSGWHEKDGPFAAGIADVTGTRFNTALCMQERVHTKWVKDEIILQGLHGTGIKELNIELDVLLCVQDYDMCLRYSTSHLSDGQALNVVSTLEKAMECLLDTPHKTIQDTCFLGDRSERDIWSWNKSIPRGVGANVHGVVEEQAKVRPNQIAVCGWDGKLTYGQIENYSSRLARFLKSRGIERETCIPLCFDKSMWMIVAMLGVLKAGATCVPISPAQPTDRLQLIIWEVQAQLMITTSAYADRFAGKVKHIVTSLPSLVERLQDDSSLVVPVSFRDAAFVMFTSGSTGIPKGVVQEHGSVYTSLEQVADAMEITSNTRCLQFASYTFDVSLCDIFVTMIRGGCVCIPSEDQRMNDLAGAINLYQANQACLTSAVARQLHPDTVPSLQQLTIGGEAPTQDLLQVWADKICLNGIYGTTESGVWDLFHSRLRQNDTPSNIGRAIGPVAWVVHASDHTKLAPVGVVGELLIEGPTLARGYLNDESKTKSAFVEDPSWLLQGTAHQPGRHGRLYKTGDLVRYSSDGTLNFVGRKDTQVKLRGQRIELGDVEYHVQRHMSDAADVVVELVAPAGRNDKSMLAAFVTLEDAAVTIEACEPRPGKETRFMVMVAAVKARLLEALPAYMIPLAFVPIRRIPLTSSGKISRRELREMASKSSTEQLQAYSTMKKPKKMPSTDMEGRLQRLWSSTLSVESLRIGTDDDFFRLGGDSLMAMKLVSEAHTEGILLEVAKIFSHPKLSDMSIAARAVEKRIDATAAPFSLLEDEIRETVLSAAVEQCHTSRDRIEDIYPCTPLQEGLMALSIKQSGRYISQNVFKLPTTIDISCVKASWEAVVDVNPVLRTRIIQTESAGSFQVVTKDDIEWRTEESLEGYISNHEQISMRPGDPLVHFGIIKEDDHFFSCFTAHHGIFDGWSIALITESVEQAYRGFTPQKPPSFNGFIRYLMNSSGSSCHDFWQSNLAETSSSVFPALPHAAYQPSPNDILEHTIRLSRRSDSTITTSTIIRASWALLVGRHTDSNDVVFGATLAGRDVPVPGIQKMSGPTITTVPIRISLSPGKGVRELLCEIQDQAAGMIPFEHMGLQNISRVSEDARNACAFQTLLVIHPPTLLEDSGRLFSTSETSNNVIKSSSYALCMQCAFTATGIIATASYDVAVIDPVQIRRIMLQFEHVLNQICIEEVSGKIDDIDVISPGDWQEILKRNTGVPEKVDSCIHHLIAQKIHERPNQPAVCSWDGNLSYDELDKSSTQLAHRLVGLGIKPEEIVPLCFQKSIWTVIAIMGVLKAGGAFVLMDPSHPTGRLEGILRKVSARVILISHTCTTDFPVSVETVIVDRLACEQTLNLEGMACTAVKPSNVAYVIFTSGSTGDPKGSVIEHAAYCSGALEHGRGMFLDSESRVLQFASYSYGACLIEMLTTLIVGGCICIPSDADRLNNIAGVINKFRVNWTIQTPASASLFGPKDVPGLRTLVLGGEPPSKALLTTWADKVRVVHAYGQSECSTVGSSLPEVTQDTDSKNIGRPLASHFWITNGSDHTRLAPLGSVGELLVEGPILARGYLNEPEKTAAVFVRYPSWVKALRQNQNGRLYRTGDLARCNPDGTTSLVGRKDYQVKLRGQRIELGEVEHHVQRCIPSATDVVAELILPAGKNKQPVLVAFVAMKDLYISETDEAGLLERQFLVTVAGLEAQLSEAVPAYMIPSAFVPVKQMPLTASGKIFRRELREKASAMSMEQLQAYTAVAKPKRMPSTAMEERLQMLWAQTLSLDLHEIGVDDGFFRLGGDSIGAMRLVSAAHVDDISLEVAKIFSHPRLSDMALVAGFSAKGHLKAIPPFSILGHGPTITKFRMEAAMKCGVDTEAIEDMYPCTPLQEGLMALSHKHIGTYVARDVYKLPSTVDAGRLKQVWNAVALSNAALRTRIIQTGDFGFMQVVLREHIRWSAVDCLHDYLTQDEGTAMDLGARLTRYAVVTDKEAKETYIVWTIHHALFDRFSIRAIIDQVSRAYNGDSVREDIPFKAFIKYLFERDCDASQSYWKDTLAGAAQSSVFPFLPSKSYQPHASAVVERRLVISRNNYTHITTASLIRAAWSILVARLAGAGDVIFGATLAGRSVPIPKVESIAGPTLTTVPIRVLVDGSLLINDFLQQVQDQSTDMIPFEHTGLQNIQRVSADAEAACSFQTLLTIQPHQQAEETTHKPIESIFRKAESADDLNLFNTYALMLVFKLGRADITVQSSFDPDVIPDAQMQRLVRHLDTILQELCRAGSGKTIQEIEHIHDEERREIWDWNETVPQEVTASIHDLVSQRASNQPISPAVYAWDGSLTYKELEGLSSRLAHHLISLGVRPEALVLLCFEKSLWAVVAMLSVMKAGAAFVPIDPSYPASRRQEILRQTEAKVVLASLQYVEYFSSIDIVIALNRSIFNNLNTGPDVSYLSTSSKNAAYVIFTSRSTGVPKGVVIEHRAISTSSYAYGKIIGFIPDSRVLQFSSYVFDASIAEIITTLIYGGCICIPSENERMEDLAGVINSMDVNSALLTPSVAKLLSPEVVPTLKTLVLIGEAINKKDIYPWVDKIQLINGYGPSECAVLCSVNNISMNQKASLGIGRSTGSVSWVVDATDDRKLAPIGALGELLIEGPILARGYLGDIEKTKIAFINDPVWLRQGAGQRYPGRSGRLYKTGDLVRYNADGTLTFIGRKDSQVKLRGQRIELGEVERTICTADEVRQAAVVFPVKGKCQQKLTAVLSLTVVGLSPTVTSGHGLQLVAGSFKDTVREKLARIQDMVSRHLPAYMLPTLWIVVDSIPFSTSGKLDRAKVTKWMECLGEEMYRMITDLHRLFHDDHKLDPPTTSTETQLRLIWSRILNHPIDRIGVNSPFFGLGGDSITAMQVVARCRAEGMSITVQDVFRCRTITRLALCAKPATSLKEFKEELNSPFDLSPIQRLYFTISRQRVNRFNQSFLLRLQRKVDTESLARAIRSIVTHHSMLRARFRQEEDRWRQLVTQDLPSSYRLRCHNLAEAEQVDEVITESQTALDVANGPVFAADFFEMEGNGQLLFLVCHHLVIDLVSWRVLLQDLEELLSSGSLSNLHPFPFQVWCRLQQEHALKHLSPATALPLPVNLPDFTYWGMEGCKNNYGNTLEESFIVDAATSSQLCGSANQPLRTEPVEILMACLLRAFECTFPDRSTPALFSEGHGRETWDTDIDLSRTVGWFTTICPLQVHTKVQGDVVETIRQTKDAHRRTPGNGWPYFACRSLNTAGQAAFGQHFPVELLFNYSGNYQQLERENALFRIEPISKPGRNRDLDPEAERMALFEATVSLSEGVLQCSLLYPSHMRNSETISQWMYQWEQGLILAAQLLSKMETRLTLSDFPLMSLNEGSLAELVDRRLKQVNITCADAVEDVYPCTAMQHGILLSQIKSPRLYNVQHVFEAVSLHISKPLDAQRIMDAWTGVVDRHAVLRTIFVKSVSGKSIFDQVVLKHIVARVSFIECGESQVSAALAQEPSLELEGRPLHQFTVCKVDSGRVFCKLDICHTITDGFSMAIMTRDLRRAYDGELPASPAPQYRQYVSYLQAKPGCGAAEYWASHLSGVEPCMFPGLEDCLDCSNEQKLVEVNLDSTDRLRAFCMQNDLTLPSVLQVAWGLVLQCFTGSDSVCFGYLVAGRDVAVQGIEDVVGLIANMLVCRIELGTAMSLLDATKDVQMNFARGLCHQHCSLAEIQHSLQLPGRTLFNTAMSFQKPPHDSLVTDSQLSLKTMSGRDPTEYGINVTIMDSGVDMSIHISYQTSVLSEMQAANVASTFERALHVIIDTPHLPCATQNLFNDYHCRQVWDWNETVPQEVTASIHDLVSQRASNQPISPAVYAWDGSLTYEELEGLSSRLARHLISLGVRPEALVLLCFEKSLWAVIAMLSVMKAGAAFVPIDPSYPASRRQEILRQTEAKVVLTSLQYVEYFSSIDIIIALNRSIFNNLNTGPDVSYLSTSSTSKNAAYVIFTSGSTGVPKGVVIEHRAISTSSYAYGKIIGITPDSRVLQFSSYVFDASIAEIITTLIYGGCICIPSENERMEDLAGVINSMDVNSALLTPSVAKLLSPEVVPTLKTLVLGGEAINKKDIYPWVDKIQLINGYGPSECAVVCSVNNISMNQKASCIGRSTGSVSWVVDATDDRKLAPIGALGELLIEGPILARGYLGDIEKTTAAFISNPPWLVEGAGTQYPGRRGRLYKTGDLVRYNVDGTLAFIGRKDSQVKLRGQRVELGDVEHGVHMALSQSGTSASVVAELVTPNDGQDPVLVAFVSVGRAVHGTAGAVDTTSTEIATGLQERLAEHIPAYMVPTAYIPVEKIPMTTTGKTDRRRLREMGGSLTLEQLATLNPSRGERRPPSTEKERQLQQLWATVLGIEAGSIGVDDSFLRVGGDSIQAMRLVGAARGQGLSFTVADVFRQPRLCDLARLLLTSVPISYSSPVPFSSLNVGDPENFIRHEVLPQLSVERGLISNVLPLAPYQTFAVEQALHTPPGQLYHFFMHFSSSINISRLKSCCTKLVDQFDSLRSVFIRSRGQLWQVVLNKLDVPFDSHEPEDGIDSGFDRLCEQDLEAPGQLGCSFLRFMILRDPQSTRLVFRLSHAQYDGVSLSQMVGAFGAFYQEQSSPKPSSFATFIEFAKLQKQRSFEYWRSFLEGSSMTTIPQRSAMHAEASVDHQALILRKYLPALTKCSDITPAVIFTAACVDMLAKFTGSTDILFGRLVSGRAGLPAELQDVVGCCINTIPVRVQIGPGKNRKDIVASVQNQYLQSIPYETVDQELWSSFGCVTQFQNIDESPGTEIAGSSIRLQARKGKYPSPRDGTVRIVGVPGRNDLRIEIVASPRYHNSDTLISMLTELSSSLSEI